MSLRQVKVEFLEALDPNPFRFPTQAGAVRIVPMGGCGEFGMNMTAFLTAGKLFVIDCGVRFPEPARLGVDAILPNVDPWFEQVGGVFAYILTHGHEDHLGALAHILPRWPAPVYGPAWAIELFKSKCSRLGINASEYTLITVESGDRITTAGFDAEYFQVNHSLPMTCSLMIRLPGINIFHTGDFKFDDHPVIEPPINYAKLAAFGAEGIDLLLADSTNAEKSGSCPGEASVLEPLKAVIDGCKGAAIVSTFSSNLWRLKTIADICIATGRRLYIAGNGVEMTLTLAKILKLYHLPESLRVSDEQVNTMPRNRLLILATGCQGEWRSALARMAAGEHKLLRVQAGDTVILSSRMIPGNERAVINMTNKLMAAGARVISAREAPGIHVSGHAYGGDIERLVELLKPKQHLPIHGAYSQMAANLGHAAISRRLPETETGRLTSSGDVLEVTAKGISLVGRIEVDLAFVDTDAGVVISYETLRERLRVGELGAALVTGVYRKEAQEWLVPPEVELIGLGLPRGADPVSWHAQLVNAIRKELQSGLGEKHLPAADVLEDIRVLVRRRLYQTLRKKPVVTVKIHIV